MICRASQASFRYANRPSEALSGVTLDVSVGEHVAIVGPNGAGKSTLLRLLAGVLRPTSGTVRFLDRPASEWPRREFARRVAVVSQAVTAEAPLSVRDVVEMGRHPYLRPWAALSPSDHDMVGEALSSVDLEGLAERPIRELSGGELQRVFLARAFAQEPVLLLLDEPTAHLDMGHEMRFMDLVSQKVVENNITVVSVTHHLNVAARFADRLLLLAGGRVVATGDARDVLQPAPLSRAFDWPVSVMESEAHGPLVLPGRRRSVAEGP